MVSKKNSTRGAVAIVATVALSACGGGSSDSSSLPPPTVQPLSAAAVAGEALFHDQSLSASGKQSCATCHVKSRAFTGDPAVDDGLPVPLGGRNMELPGFRNSPSLMYAAFTPAFSIEDGTASGGFFRDGRASGYNDLPVALDANVNVGEVPYTAPALAGGNGPTLNAQEIDDLVAFLCTLTDGYDPSNPSAYNVPTQCQPIASP